MQRRQTKPFVSMQAKGRLKNCRSKTDEVGSQKMIEMKENPTTEQSKEQNQIEEIHQLIENSNQISKQEQEYISAKRLYRMVQKMRKEKKSKSKSKENKNLAKQNRNRKPKIFVCESESVKVQKKDKQEDMILDQLEQIFNLNLGKTNNLESLKYLQNILLSNKNISSTEQNQDYNFILYILNHINIDHLLKLIQEYISNETGNNNQDQDAQQQQTVVQKPRMEFEQQQNLCTSENGNLNDISQIQNKINVISDTASIKKKLPTIPTRRNRKSLKNTSRPNRNRKVPLNILKMQMQAQSLVQNLQNRPNENQPNETNPEQFLEQERINTLYAMPGRTQIKTDNQQKLNNKLGNNVQRKVISHQKQSPNLPPLPLKTKQIDISDQLNNALPHGLEIQVERFDSNQNNEDTYVHTPLQFFPSKKYPQSSQAKKYPKQQQSLSTNYDTFRQIPIKRSLLRKIQSDLKPKPYNENAIQETLKQKKGKVRRHITAPGVAPRQNRQQTQVQSLESWTSSGQDYANVSEYPMKDETYLDHQMSEMTQTIENFKDHSKRYVSERVMQSATPTLEFVVEQNQTKQDNQIPNRKVYKDNQDEIKKDRNNSHRKLNNSRNNNITPRKKIPYKKVYESKQKEKDQYKHFHTTESDFPAVQNDPDFTHTENESTKHDFQYNEMAKSLIKNLRRKLKENSQLYTTDNTMFHPSVMWELERYNKMMQEKQRAKKQKRNAGHPKKQVSSKDKIRQKGLKQKKNKKQSKSREKLQKNGKKTKSEKQKLFMFEDVDKQIIQIEPKQHQQIEHQQQICCQQFMKVCSDQGQNIEIDNNGQDNNYWCQQQYFPQGNNGMQQNYDMQMQQNDQFQCLRDLQQFSNQMRKQLFPNNHHKYNQCSRQSPKMQNCQAQTHIQYCSPSPQQQCQQSNNPYQQSNNRYQQSTNPYLQSTNPYQQHVPNQMNWQGMTWCHNATQMYPQWGIHQKTSRKWRRK